MIAVDDNSCDIIFYNSGKTKVISLPPAPYFATGSGVLDVVTDGAGSVGIASPDNFILGNDGVWKTFDFRAYCAYTDGGGITYVLGSTNKLYKIKNRTVIDVDSIPVQLEIILWQNSGPLFGFASNLNVSDDGKIWFTYPEDYYVNNYSGVKNVLACITSDGDFISYIDSFANTDNIGKIILTSDGRMVASAYNHIYYDSPNGLVEDYLSGTFSSTPNPKSLCADTSGNILMATNTANGFYRYDFTQVELVAPLTALSIADASVDIDNSLWVLAQGKIFHWINNAWDTIEMQTLPMLSAGKIKVDRQGNKIFWNKEVYIYRQGGPAIIFEQPEIIPTVNTNPILIPNPSGEAPNIIYSLSSDAVVTINIYNVLAQQIIPPDIQSRTKGVNVQPVNGINDPGIYFVELIGDGLRKTLKFVKY